MLDLRAWQMVSQAAKFTLEMLLRPRPARFLFSDTPPPLNLALYLDQNWHNNTSANNNSNRRQLLPLESGISWD